MAAGTRSKQKSGSDGSTNVDLNMSASNVQKWKALRRVTDDVLKDPDFLLYAAVCVKEMGHAGVSDMTAIQQLKKQRVKKLISAGKEKVEKVKDRLRRFPASERLKVNKEVLASKKKPSSDVLENYESIDDAKTYLSHFQSTIKSNSSKRTKDSLRLETDIWFYWSFYDACAKQQKRVRVPHKDVLDRCLSAYDELESFCATSGKLTFETNPECYEMDVLGSQVTGLKVAPAAGQIVESDVDDDQPAARGLNRFFCGRSVSGETKKNEEKKQLSVAKEIQQLRMELKEEKDRNQALKATNLTLHSQHEELLAKQKAYHNEVRSLSQSLEVTRQDLKFKEEELRHKDEEFDAMYTTTEDKLRTADQRRSDDLQEKDQNWTKEIAKLEQVLQANYKETLNKQLAAFKSMWKSEAKSSVQNEKDSLVARSDLEMEEISDHRRPSETAKRFEDLFNRSYDVADCLQEAQGENYSERIGSQFVLSLLKTVYDAVALTFDEIKGKLIKALDLDDTVADNPLAQKTVYEFSISILKIMSTRLRQQYEASAWMKAIRCQKWREKKTSKELEESADTFLSHCIPVCWDMVLQKQRLVPVTDHKTFDPSLHEHFFNSDKTSKNISYFVWPCLREGARFLVKGKVVAEATTQRTP